MATRRSTAAKAPTSPAANARTKERKSVASLLRLTHRLYSRALLAAIQDRGVTTIVQWWILRTLWTEDGLTQRELSERIGLYESAIVSVIDSLVEKGLIVRSRNSTDRRKINVHLTKAGRALERTLIPAADEVNRIARGTVDARSLEVMWATLGVVHDNLVEHLQRAKG